MKMLINIIFTIAILVLKWSNNNNVFVQSENCDTINDPIFSGSKILDANDGYKVSWKIEKNELYLKLEINAINSNGFMGFGFGEETSGSMLGADIVTVRINNGKLIVEDRNVPFDPYPIDNYSPSFPVLDNCQDWEIIKAETSSTSWKAIIKRKLSTGDEQDRDIIKSGPQRIIYAWSTTAISIQYHGKKRGASSIDFTSDNYSIPIPNDVETIIDLTMGNYSLSSESDTYYACKGFDLSQYINLNNGDRHIVRIDPIIQKGNEKYVHHMLVHVCGTEVGEPYQNHAHNKPADVCQGSGIGTSPLSQGTCVTIMYVWAVGSGPFIFPDNVGARIGLNNTSGFTNRYVPIN